MASEQKALNLGEAGDRQTLGHTFPCAVGYKLNTSSLYIACMSNVNL